MDWMNGLSAFSRWVLSTTIKASVMVGLIGLIQILTKNRLPAKWRHGLWFLLVIRLLLPVGIESRMSVFNLIKPAPLEYVISRELPGQIISPSASTGFELHPASVPPPEKRILLSKDQILSLIWLSGVIFLIIVTGIGILRLRKKLKFKQLVNDPDLIRLLNECKNRMGVRSAVGMYRIQGLRIPLLYGLIRPCILLPQNISEWRDLDELKHILCHELAHHKRKDIAVGCLATVLQTIHWFNPLIWFAFHRMRIDRELACDALTISRLGPDQSQSYGQTLISLMDRLSSTVHLPLTAGILDMKSGLKRRMTMIAKFRRRSTAWSFIAAAVLIAAGCFALTEARKTTAPPDEKTTVQDEAFRNDSDKAGLNKSVQTMKNQEKPLKEFRIVVDSGGITCNDRRLALKYYINEPADPVKQFKLLRKEIADQITNLGIDKNTVICVVPGEKVNSSLYYSVLWVVNSLPVKGIKVFNPKTGFYVITPPHEDRFLSIVGSPFQPVSKEGKWGYYKYQIEEMVIKPQFDQADRFFNGYAAVKLNGKWGYIDTTGNWTIRPSFDHAAEFREDLAVVKIGEKFGFIDKTGRIMIQPRFENGYAFYEGLAAVKMEGKWGYINKRGETIIPFQFDETYFFSDDLAAVQTNGQWGYINKKGDKVIPLVFKHTEPFFDGLAAVQVDNAKFGFIDKNGRMVIDPVYDSVSDFNNGNAMVTIFENPEKGIKGQGFFIDKAGNIISDEGESIKVNQPVSE
jgi:beta-lactamase regulating signal transducer with metallopeptidase domain